MVTSFMKLHSLQPHVESLGGDGMNTFEGLANFIWCITPGSVAIIYTFEWSFLVKFRRAAVDPIKSAIILTGSSHSGCTNTFASWFDFLSSKIASSENS